MWKHIILQSLVEIAILLVLYLAAPKFINEGEGSEMHKLAETIEKCFLKLPGNATDPRKILYGNEEKWYKTNIWIFKNETNETIDNDTNITSFATTIETGNCSDLYEKWNYPNNLQEAYNNYLSMYGGTTHMTLIFDVFVIYTLFNQINCRIIDDSLNTFKRITKGYLFIIVTLAELTIQILISQLGYIVFHCVHWGLGPIQWVWCLGFSISTMLFNLLFKFIPLEKLIDPFTKGPTQQNAEQATSTIMEMVNQNLRD